MNSSQKTIWKKLGNFYKRLGKFYYYPKMGQKRISHRQIYISWWFALSLVVMTCLIFLDGYAHAHLASTDLWGVPTGGQNQILSHQIIPDPTDPLSAIHPTFDFTSDDSFQRYLDPSHPFQNINYVPADLAPINSNFTANDARKFELRQEAGDSFADMAWHFRDHFGGDRLSITSAYRSESFQKSLLKNWCSDDLCAKPGTSEHQAWLALDLSVVTKWGRTISMDKPNKYTDWLHAYAQEWGFHNTYQKGIAIDGKVVEWWHRRYLGTWLATLLFENNQTFAEYYKTVNR